MTEEITDYNYIKRNSITNLHPDISYCEVNKCDAVKRLKQKHNDDTEEIAKLGLDVAILEQENEELRKENEEWHIKYAGCNTANNAIQEENKQYRSALEEIKEIATNYFEECGVPDDYFKRNNYSWKQHQIKAFTCKLQQIIDKINEALGNEI